MYFDSFIVRQDSSKESSFCVGKIALGRLMWVVYCVVDIVFYFIVCYCVLLFVIVYLLVYVYR